MISSAESVRAKAVTSGSGVMALLAVMSPKSNTFSIHSCSSSSMVPCSPLDSTIRRSSSSLATPSSASSFMPSSFSVPLVHRFSRANMGAKITLTARSTRKAGTAKSMGFCMAMRLGTISPKAMEKKEMISVMTTVEMTATTPAGRGRRRVPSRKSSR